MNVTRKIIVSFFIGNFLVLFTPSDASAANCGSYLFAPRPQMGLYLECAIPPLFSIVQVIVVAAALVLAIFLIFKTVKAFGDANSQAIQEIPQKWGYLLLIGIVAIGAGGTAINIVLKFFGFDDGVGFFLPFFNDLIEKIKDYES